MHVDRKRDLAARAGWLYYIAGNTQDEIAGKLAVSRQAAQRLVAQAVAEKLVKFRIDHPFVACMELADALQTRFGLTYCEVAPTDPAMLDPTPTLAVVAAHYLETLLAQKMPQTVGFGTGRTLRATVEEMAPMRRPDHRIVTIVGTMTEDGRASPYDVAMRLAARIGAPCYPMPTPVVTGSADERRILQTQGAFTSVRRIASEASLHLVGIGEIGWGCPMHAEGFLADGEVPELIAAGAVGEIASWPYDAHGRLIDHPIIERLAGLELSVPPALPRIGVAGGEHKVQAMAAALGGGLLTGLITDEHTARRLLARRAHDLDNTPKAAE